MWLRLRKQDGHEGYFRRVTRMSYNEFKRLESVDGGKNLSFDEFIGLLGGGWIFGNPQKEIVVVDTFSGFDRMFRDRKSGKLRKKRSAEMLHCRSAFAVFKDRYKLALSSVTLRR